MASTTRDRIVNIIQRRQSETVSGLASELSLAPATVRRHLDILQRDGLVTFTEIRKGTGRPEFSFSLTEPGHESLPKHYADMLAGLVRQLEQMEKPDIGGRSGGQVLSLALSRLADEMVAEQQAHNGHRTGMSALVEFLEQRDYAPEVSETEEGLTLRTSSCPYRAVASANPALCQFDTALIERMLGIPVERKASVSRGDACCMHFVPADSAR